MTLVVGRVSEGMCCVLSDTALTQVNRSTNPYTEGCLKSYLVTPEIAIAFADSQHAFERAATGIFARSDVPEIVAEAARAQRSGLEFELLVCRVGSETLWTVKGGQVLEAVSGFLGHTGAFDAYQRYFHEPASIPNSVPEGSYGSRLHANAVGPYMKMFDAFKAVVDSHAFHEVGGVIIPLCTDDGLFKYGIYTDVFAPMPVPKENEATVLSFGTAAEGGYATEFCSDPTGSEPSIYFLQGEFGLVFPRTETGYRPAVLLRARTSAHFLLAVCREYGFIPRTLFMNADVCGMAGFELQLEGKPSDAVFVYELPGAQGVQSCFRDRPAIHDLYVSDYARALVADRQDERAIAVLDAFLSLNPPVADRCLEIRWACERLL